MPRMGHFLFRILFVLMLGVAPVSAGSLDAGEVAMVREVIQVQLEAIGRDDGQTAFAYAAPAIQERFGSPDDFLQMVHNSMHRWSGRLRSFS
jgi:hypothetical protein